MQKKQNKIFVCSKCDAQSLKWTGRCLECGAWGTLEEQFAEDKEENTKNINSAELLNLSDLDDKQDLRIKTNISEIENMLLEEEFDREKYLEF